MAASDRERWDERYRTVVFDQIEPEAPAAFADLTELFPRSGQALDVACGRGAHAVWLAMRGLHVVGLDVSAEAVRLATAVAEAHDVHAHCEFELVDLDSGLPDGPPVDLVLCHMFRAPALDRSIVDRLVVGGILAVAALSEVGASPGRFRVAQGDLLRSFDGLDIIAHDERDGTARLIACKV